MKSFVTLNLFREAAGLRAGPCSGTMSKMSTRHDRLGFTLIEICVVLFLVIMLVSVAMPSLSGQMARRRLQEASDRLDEIASRARERSVSERRPYVLIWEKDGSIALFPADTTQAARNKSGPLSTLKPSGSNERYTLVRPSSLTTNPASEWTFWPTGNCEPVTVRYQGSGGEWETIYNPLSGRGVFSKFIAR